MLFWRREWHHQVFSHSLALAQDDVLGEGGSEKDAVKEEEEEKLDEERMEEEGKRKE